MALRLYQTLADVPAARRAIALGTFDGVHLGHREVMETAIAEARALDVPAMVATFHPHPMSITAPERAPEALSSLARRVALIGEVGADEVVIIRFDRALASREAEDFAEHVLVDALGARAVVTGADFRFGHDRRGDAALLLASGARHRYTVTSVPLLEIDGERVSSTGIRRRIRAGDVEGAARLLGRPPEVEGAVIRGDARGRELGVPTANLAVPPGYALPAEGVYSGLAVLPRGQGVRRAAISIGTNPTFAGTRDLRIEAHLLDFDDDLYGSPLRLEFRRFLRGQQAFASLDELVRQMDVDISRARAEPLEGSRRIGSSDG